MGVFFGAHNIISPLGFTSSENFSAVLEAKVGPKKHNFEFSEKPIYCSKINVETLNEKFTALGKPSEYTFLEKMCILSIHDVVTQSGIDLNNKSNLLILSTTKGNVDILENKYPHISPERAYLSNFANTVGDYFKCVNAPLVVSNACISGLLAIIIAKRFIENKNYKNIIVCGADLVSEFTLSGFKSFNAMSDEACKPFDKNRTGINLGEAAASILLSEDKLSNITILSGASANDANHISGPSRTGDGLFQAVSQSMATAGNPSLDFISAHGTATEYNDEMESVAFSRAELNGIPINSLKGYYGHTLGAAGVIESIISIQSLSENKLIKSMGFENQGTTAALNMIQKTEHKELSACLKTASGFGGCNAAAIFKKI
ncbi:beta-ketoacyl synthase N-terminal-like domain-containing protein [Aurantibacillus circumpalustris]|uniref:beta-ketoacyl synthase N-terminal-like domain-containing protein n=1 Tax=Aurantibacillus circumpalustris TaxID=3036359 RepID=UPI00295A8A0A|nr:beta-ketoacyl synthase N-terminal-like domain-containing protein [Aurantibacillus circumpalustris]